MACARTGCSTEIGKRTTSINRAAVSTNGKGINDAIGIGVPRGGESAIGVGTDGSQSVASRAADRGESPPGIDRAAVSTNGKGRNGAIGIGVPRGGESAIGADRSQKVAGSAANRGESPPRHRPCYH